MTALCSVCGQMLTVTPDIPLSGVVVDPDVTRAQLFRKLGGALDLHFHAHHQDVLGAAMAAAAILRHYLLATYLQTADTEFHEMLAAVAAQFDGALHSKPGELVKPEVL